MSPRTGFCEGCWRSIEEIAAWSRMNDDEKRAVWVLIEERREGPMPADEA
jgi:uncharacterized protein